MCVLTQGRKKACREQVGGVKRIFVQDWNLVTGKTYDVDGQLTDVAAVTVYQIDLPNGTAEFNQTLQSSRENGTVYYEQALTINLFGLSKEDRKGIQVMARMNLTIFVEDFNGNVFELGRDGGMDTNGGGVKTGKAKGDMSGYTIEWMGEEKDQAPFVEPYTSVPFDTIANITVSFPA
jgi:hypothetical protein